MVGLCTQNLRQVIRMLLDTNTTLCVDTKEIIHTHALPGAEGVTSGTRHASTRTIESGSALLAVSAH